MRSIEDINNLLLAGADKVSINTAAVSNANLIKEGAEKFGSQCIVVAVDAKKIKSLNNPNIEGVIIGKAIYDGDIQINDLAKLI